MRDLTQEILELIRFTSTNLPEDVEKALREAYAREEPGSAAHGALETILANVEMTRRNSTPICQDTGTPIFFVCYPEGWSPRRLREQIKEAVALATRKNYLRPNAVDSLSGKNTGDNLGDQHFPVIHFEECDGEELTIELMLKGGGCENVGRQYSLPDNTIKAGRDLEGVRRAALDAVWQAQGEGCAPGFLGISIGGDRGTSYIASKEALLRRVDDANPNPELADLEERITREANQLGIGPMGFGGKATVLGTKITTTHRLPASFFVTVSYMCWAYRRRKMTVRGEQVTYE
ncbi:hydro-lyases, Fe-S type, tartrate/fumarate subfamily, alpha region [Anaerolinea thermolimosa]|uniref:fumarate hydratase n=1 Tax=Anaerolinea thermolimosa TaxID=229919 RepID=UPI0007828095|nr:fumarate hydratase [Anaerolinea thermolimosa]GAP05391.1 hydro-lyases, Fe-S type, tartrate/fumarate subfamily, alpha region [Anaerolinea thermolimosa]